MKTLRRRDLASEIQFAATRGEGLRPGTTVENFAVNRGGYNCRHQAIPIREENFSNATEV